MNFGRRDLIFAHCAFYNRKERFCLLSSLTFYVYVKKRKWLLHKKTTQCCSVGSQDSAQLLEPPKFFMLLVFLLTRLQGYCYKTRSQLSMQRNRDVTVTCFEKIKNVCKLAFCYSKLQVLLGCINLAPYIYSTRVYTTGRIFLSLRRAASKHVIVNPNA